MKFGVAEIHGYHTDFCLVKGWGEPGLSVQ